MSGREYDPPIYDFDAALRAAEEMGRSFAKQNCRLAVFSAKPEYIETFVVRGFVAELRKRAKKERKDRIEVHAPLGGDTSFPERQKYADIFRDRTDQHANWRRSFVRALAEVDAVLLIGGGRMTAAIGHASLAFGIPVVAVARYGGAARDVWQAIAPNETTGYIQKEHEEMMAGNWSAENAVANLLAHIERRKTADADMAKAARAAMRLPAIRAGAAVVILLGAISTTWLASQFPAASWVRFLLYVVGPIGGASAALTASSLQDAPPHGIVHSTSLGFMAGFLASAVYLLAQMSSATFEPKELAYLFACMTGIGAGFAAEKVIREWMAGRHQLPTAPRPGRRGT